MKYFFLFILQVFSNEIPKCIHCKFFQKHFIDNKYGKCLFFPKTEVQFVTDEHDNDSHYYCSTARKYEDMCGKEGKKYVRK